MLKYTLDDHWESGLYMPKYDSPEHIVKHLRKLGKFSVCDSISYEHTSVYNKHSYRRTSQSRQTRMMGLVITPQRSYKMALQYEQMRIGETLGGIDERYSQIKQNGLYLLREGKRLKWMIYHEL